MHMDCELLPSPIGDDISAISYILGRGFISIPETVLLGIETQPKPACSPGAVVMCLASANHLLSGVKMCLCLALPTRLCHKALTQ